MHVIGKQKSHVEDDDNNNNNNTFGSTFQSTQGFFTGEKTE